jgi:hypothetical protein
MARIRVLCARSLLCAAILGLSSAARGEEQWIVMEGTSGPGLGKHVVLVSGDEEYRSEETIPQLAKILAVRHGFKCTVLFAIDPADGTINPDVRHNIPGLEALDQAELAVFFLRFRDLPDEQMKHVVDYVQSGRPIIGLRTSTHAFDIPDGNTYSRWSWKSKEWDGGFGRQVLGETWVAHHGHHGKESTRGLVAPGQESHPILRGIRDGDAWGPTDVYAVRLPLPEGSTPVLMGQVLSGMTADSTPVDGPKNSPMMPIAWMRTYTPEGGQPARVFTTTMGASQDLKSEGTRRLLVNACYWAVGLEDRIRADSSVGIVGTFDPLPFGFGTSKKGLRPADHRLSP